MENYTIESMIIYMFARGARGGAAGQLIAGRENLASA